MEPDKQVEIQLGHMCNNRCVFCVSGQRTGLRQAFPLPLAPILARIDEAYERGHRKITLLGGEPTLQPGFLDVVRHAVARGFAEIVIFTNGVKTARDGFVDEIRATGGNFTWRISIQGATEESHEGTTRRPGSFRRILRTLSHLRARGERITVNMCVVRSNFESVDRFPELLLPYGVTQLHLDMMRPLDAGDRTDEEMAAMLPRYSDMVEPLTRMVRGFPAGFDVNIGNLPYCIAPELAPVIHHDGERTDTVAVDGDDSLSRPWDKYLVKRRDKVKPDSCRRCVFDARCSGVFETYRAMHGQDELVPITIDRLRAIDPGRRLLALHLRPLAGALAAGDRPVRVVERGDRELELEDGALRVALRPPGADGAAAGLDGFDVVLLEAPPDGEDALRALVARLVAAGHPLRHPPGDDALRAPARSIVARLRRLRAAAPFAPLAWTDVRLAADGRRAELALRGPAGERATVWLAEEGRRATGGYRVDGEATPALTEGLGALMAALRSTG
jgi:MoaA/NifB/PqqE/SkfB family radical SAM enzyme